LLAEYGELAFSRNHYLLAFFGYELAWYAGSIRATTYPKGLVTIGAEAGFGRLPDTGRDLRSQPTASRREREVAELSREAAAIVGDYDEFVKRLRRFDGWGSRGHRCQ
jgi:hypothetical protein